MIPDQLAAADCLRKVCDPDGKGWGSMRGGPGKPARSGKKIIHFMKMKAILREGFRNTMGE